MPDLGITPHVAEASDLNSCDREQIQFINAIQSFGFLLAVSSDWKISHASANIGDFLGRAVDTLRDARLQDVIRGDAVAISPRSTTRRGTSSGSPRRSCGTRPGSSRASTRTRRHVAGSRRSRSTWRLCRIIWAS